MPLGQPYIFLLPDELLLEIYSYLPWPDLLFLRRSHVRFDRIFKTRDLLPLPSLPGSPYIELPHASRERWLSFTRDQQWDPPVWTDHYLPQPAGNTNTARPFNIMWNHG